MTFQYMWWCHLTPARCMKQCAFFFLLQTIWRHSWQSFALWLGNSALCFAVGDKQVEKSLSPSCCCETCVGGELQIKCRAKFHSFVRQQSANRETLVPNMVVFVGHDTTSSNDNDNKTIYFIFFCSVVDSWCSLCDQQRSGFSHSHWPDWSNRAEISYLI